LQRLVFSVRSETLPRMRLRSVLLSFAAAATLAAPSAASADFLHVVGPGETLTSVAATDGMSVDQLAAANGISPDTQLIAGATLAIPPQTAPASAAVSNVAPGGSVASAGGGSYLVQPGDTLSAIAARAGMSVADLAALNGLDPTGYLLSGTVLKLGGGAGAPATSTSASATSGSYVVQPGDTLSAIAARAGMTLDGLAALNGLNPNDYLLIGTVLRLGASAPAPSAGSAATSQPVGAVAQGSAVGPPYPTPERVSASEVGSIAAANGVPSSLADAIGWQESGFNNDLISSAGARGVMQILPGTWQWITSSLSPSPLSSNSAADNVRGGVLMLHSLLGATGGNQAMAAAGYYQGLPSVLRNGLYSDTQQYVNDVMSLARQYGGG
jgi:LysM repeat protein